MSTSIPNPQAIDVTGLPPDAVRAVEDMVQQLRSPARAAHPNRAPGGPPLDQTPEEWIKGFQAWLATLPPAPGADRRQPREHYGDDE